MFWRAVLRSIFTSCPVLWWVRRGSQNTGKVKIQTRFSTVQIYKCTTISTKIFILVSCVFCTITNRFGKKNLHSTFLPPPLTSSPPPITTPACKKTLATFKTCNKTRDVYAIFYKPCVQPYHSISPS